MVFGVLRYCFSNKRFESLHVWCQFQRNSYFYMRNDMNQGLSSKRREVKCPPPAPPSCEDRRWCRGVSVKWYGHGSFEHIAHSGGKNDPDDKRASCEIQAFVAFRNWIKFGTFIYLTDTLRRSQRLRIWFKSRGVKLYSDFRRLVTLNEIEQRWMPWSMKLC